MAEADLEDQVEDITRRTARLEWGDGSLDLVPDSSLTLASSSRKLVGKVLLRRKIGRLAVRSSLVEAWSVIAVWYLQEEGPKVFVFTLKSQEDKELVLERRPWNLWNSHDCSRAITWGGVAKFGVL